jgi:hypothetical protein
VLETQEKLRRSSGLSRDLVPLIAESKTNRPRATPSSAGLGQGLGLTARESVCLSAIHCVSVLTVLYTNGIGDH